MKSNRTASIIIESKQIVRSVNRSGPSKDSPDYLDLMAHSYVSELSWIGPLICISREMRDWLVTECTHYFIKSILLSDSINYSHLTAIKAQKKSRFDGASSNSQAKHH